MDIGYCSLLRLSSEGRSQLWQSDSQPELVNINTLQWSEEISLNAAQASIEKQFYPFKEVSE